MPPLEPPFPPNPGDSDDEQDPLGGWPLLGDLARLLRSPAVSRQAADQLAVAVASDGATEANVSPSARASFSELAGIAQLAAEAATGLASTADHGSVEIAVVNRSGWAHQTLRDWRPHFQQLQEGLRAGQDSAEPATPDSGPEEMLRQLMEPLAPLLADMTAGSLTGRLARVALGSYDVALPRVRSDRLLLVEPNISAFARSWSLQRDDTCLWVCVHSLITNAILSVPWVHQQLTDLLKTHAHSFEIDPNGILESLQKRLEDLDPETAMVEMPALLSSPEALLGITPSETQRQITTQLQEFLSVLTSYVDITTERTCEQLLGSQNLVREAFRRRRLMPPGEARQVARLLGLDLTAEATGRGRRFVEGVIERAGTDGLGRLWQTAGNWPTSSEIDAAGLWLARLEIYEDLEKPSSGDNNPTDGNPEPGTSTGAA